MPRSVIMLHRATAGKNPEINQRLLRCTQERVDGSQEHVGERVDLRLPWPKKKKRNFRSLWIQRI